MTSPGIIHSVALVRINVSEECITSIIRVIRIVVLRLLLTANVPGADSCHPGDGGDTFLRNVGSYYSNTASHRRRRILHSQL
jgi:hypothetical protein